MSFCLNWGWVLGAMSKNFFFLEDMALADAAFEAWGNTPSELFVAAGQALIELMVDHDTVIPQIQRNVVFEEHMLSELLFDWLSRIVYLKDAESLVFSDAQAIVTSDQKRQKWALHGTLQGDHIDPSHHVLRSDVKAITKHQYSVNERSNQWVVRVVVDL